MRRSDASLPMMLVPMALALIVGLVAFAPQGTEARGASAQASGSELDGLARVSGTVTAAESFQTARVYFRHVDKQVQYMVYAVGGEYQAMHLFPGNYELTVKARGLVSDVQNVVLEAGVNDAQNVTLRAADPTTGGAVVSYDELYPPGPARDLAESNCMACHGPTFLSEKSWGAGLWDLAIEAMAAEGRIDFSQPERETLVAYLAENFGPDSTPRTLDLPDIPADEERLRTAMYIEYYLPPHPEGWESGVREGQDPHFDQEGYVWVTDRGDPYSFLKLDPRSGEWKGQWLNPGVGFSHGLTIDSEGVVWLPESDGGNHLNAFDTKTEKFVGRYDYNADGALDGWTGRPTRSHTPVLDSQENVWVSMILGDKLLKWDRQTKTTTLYEPDSSPSQPYGLDVDADDNIWVVLSSGAPRVAKFDSKTEEWTEYPALTRQGRIRRLSVDRKGIVWFGIHTAGKIGRLDPATGDMTEIDVPLEYGSIPYDIQPDSENNMWFGDSGQNSAIVMYEQSSGSFTFYPAPQTTDFPKIELTRDDAIWYCPRSADEPGVGVLYPDMTKITTLGAYYEDLTWRSRDGKM